MKEITPYDSAAESKKNQVSRMFNNIAGYYDFLNHFLSLGIDRSWRKKAVKQLEDKSYPIILDIATGTADVALAIAQSVDCEKIIGVDIANEMLEIGRKKIDKRQLSDKISLELGDSENLRFDDNYVDAVTVAFGVRNFEHVEKGLLEIKRVLKPGGKLIVLEFAKPQMFPFKQLYHTYFRYILPLIGRLTSKDPKAYKYLYESVQAFPGGRDFVQLLDKLGFQKTSNQPLTLGICHIYLGCK